MVLGMSIYSAVIVRLLFEVSIHGRGLTFDMNCSR